MTARRPLEFGISVTPDAEAYPQIVEQVLTAERTGFELVGIQDHPYQRRFLDTFSLIADLLARTSRLRFFPDVATSKTGTVFEAFVPAVAVSLVNAPSASAPYDQMRPMRVVT